MAFCSIKSHHVKISNAPVKSDQAAFFDTQQIKLMVGTLDFSFTQNILGWNSK